MRQVLKKDWEMIRIFLILAILTFGFVWGVQSLILTPTATPHIQGYSSSGSSPVDMEPHKDAVALGKLGIYPNVLNQSLLKTPIPLRGPTGLSKDK